MLKYILKLTDVKSMPPAKKGGQQVTYSLPVPAATTFNFTNPADKTTAEVLLVSEELGHVLAGVGAENAEALKTGLRKSFGFTKPEEKITATLWKTQFNLYTKILEAGKCTNQQEEIAAQQISTALFVLEQICTPAFAELVKAETDKNIDEWTAWIAVSTELLAPPAQVNTDPTTGANAGSTTQVTVIDGNAVSERLRKVGKVFAAGADLLNTVTEMNMKAANLSRGLAELANFEANALPAGQTAPAPEPVKEEEVSI